MGSPPPAHPAHPAHDPPTAGTGRVGGGLVLSEEAAWGLWSLLMMLIVWLGWAGRDDDDTPASDDADAGGAARPGGTAEATTRLPSPPTPGGSAPLRHPVRRPTPAQAGGPRRRGAFVATLVAAGAAAWVAGVRSAGRR